MVGMCVPSSQELGQLAAELRAEIVHTVSKTGGHLSASLGVVDLAVALHHVFDAPHDKILWDVGHQVSEISCSFSAPTESPFYILSSSLKLDLVATAGLPTQDPDGEEVQDAYHPADIRTCRIPQEG